MIETCEGCGNEIDPYTCGCGDPVEGHGYWNGHGAIPWGCDCGRIPDTDQEDQPS